MLTGTNLFKMWHSENISTYMYCNRNREYVFLQGQRMCYIYHISHIQAVASHFCRICFWCHTPIQCETFVPRFYLSLSSTLNVWESQSQPKIRWMGLTDHKGFQWTVKQRNEPVTKKKRLSGLRHSKASYCSELHCIISLIQMRISGRKKKLWLNQTDNSSSKSFGFCMKNLVCIWVWNRIRIFTRRYVWTTGTMRVWSRTRILSNTYSMDTDQSEQLLEINNWTGTCPTDIALSRTSGKQTVKWLYWILGPPSFSFQWPCPLSFTHLVHD